jgi:hypothetical protein
MQSYTTYLIYIQSVHGNFSSCLTEEQKIDLLTAATEDLLDCGLRTLRCTYLGRRRNERVVEPAAAFISADPVRAHSRPLLFTAIRLHFWLRRIFTVARAFPFFHMCTHTPTAFSLFDAQRKLLCLLVKFQY